MTSYWSPSIYKIIMGIYKIALLFNLDQNKQKKRKQKSKYREKRKRILAQLAFPRSPPNLSLAQPTRGNPVFYPAPEQAARRRGEHAHDAGPSRPSPASLCAPRRRPLAHASSSPSLEPLCFVVFPTGRVHQRAPPPAVALRRGQRLQGASPPCPG